MKRHGKQRIFCLANKYMKNKIESSVMKRKKFTKKTTQNDRNKRDLIKKEKYHRDDCSDWKKQKRILEMM